MVSEWPRYTTKDLISSGILTIGDGYRAKNSELSSNGIPFARAGNINNGFQFDKADRFPEQDLYKVGEKVSKPGDVVFTSKGTVGRFGFVSENTQPFVYSPQLCYWRSNQVSKLDAHFLYYWMNSVQFISQISWAKGQTDMADYVSLRDQREGFSVTVPPIYEQRAIAHILGTLDDKIELNRRMNETLEATASAIFKSWFVDFDPVRAKAEGRPPEGMDAETAALFPDGFEDSELGEIPKGWIAQSIPDVIDINPRYSIKKGVEAPYVDMKSVPEKGHSISCIRMREFTSGTKFINGDTLLARITPCLENGKTAFVDSLPDATVGWGSTEFIVLRPIMPLPKIFGYMLARDPNFRTFAIQNMTGTSGRQRVPPKCLERYYLAVAPEPIVNMFGQLTQKMFSKVKANNNENITLSELRDTLLPKLLSGEIRVKDAEHYIKEAI